MYIYSFPITVIFLELYTNITRRICSWLDLLFNLCITKCASLFCEWKSVLYITHFRSYGNHVQIAAIMDAPYIYKPISGICASHSMMQLGLGYYQPLGLVRLFI